MWVSKIVTSLWPGAVALKPLPMSTVTDARRKYIIVTIMKCSCEFVTQCLQLESQSLVTDGTDTALVTQAGLHIKRSAFVVGLFAVTAVYYSLRKKKKMSCIFWLHSKMIPRPGSISKWPPLSNMLKCVVIPWHALGLESASLVPSTARQTWFTKATKRRQEVIYSYCKDISTCARGKVNWFWHHVSASVAYQKATSSEHPCPPGAAHELQRIKVYHLCYWWCIILNYRCYYRLIIWATNIFITNY